MKLTLYQVLGMLCSLFDLAECLDHVYQMVLLDSVKPGRKLAHLNYHQIQRLNRY